MRPAASEKMSFSAAGLIALLPRAVVQQCADDLS